MSTKSHSGLKRALAWMLTVAMMAQGCIVYADDFTSEPDAAVVSEAVSEADTSTDSDLEFADDGEDTSTDVDTPDISDEDVDADISADDQQTADDVASEDPFSDGSDISTFSDGADAVGDETTTNSAHLSGYVDIADGQQYSYTQVYEQTDTSRTIRYLLGQYPANGSSISMSLNDQRYAIWHRVAYTGTTKYENPAQVSSTNWSNGNSSTSSTYGSYVSWTSSDPETVQVTKNGANGCSAKLTALKETTEPVTITATWNDTKYKTGTVTSSFKVTVNPARKVVNAGETFELEGSISSPSARYYKYSGSTRENADTVFWMLGNLSSSPYVPEAELLSVSGTGFQKATAKYNKWRSEGTILHKYIIDFDEMINTPNMKPGDAGYVKAGANVESNKFRTTSAVEYLYQPMTAPADGIYLRGDVSTGAKMVDGNVVFDKVSPNSSIYVYAYGVKDGKKIAVRDIDWKSRDIDDVDGERDPSVVRVYNKNSDVQLQLRSDKVGGAVITGTYQEKDGDGNPVGEPLTLSFRVFVRGFYINEPVGDDGSTKTVQLSLDEEDNAKTKAINITAIDGSGETGVASNVEGITWSIDKPTVASVDSDGNVTAKSAGEATVTAEDKNWGTSDTVKIIVKGSGSLALDKTEAKVTKGGTATIKATATSNGSTVRNPEITWESEDTNIATVSGGTITGVNYGTTTVKASWVASNGKTYTNSLPVSVVYNGLYLSDAQNEVTLAQGSTQEILWQIQDMGEYSKGSTGNGYNSSSDVTWASANEEVATVDSAGVVTAKALPEGETAASTTITVSYKGNKAKEIKVNVINNQTIATGTTVEVAGTKGEQVTSKTDGSDISNEWKAGSYKDGHGSLNAQFNSNRDNFDIVDGTGSTATVTGKTPSEGYAYLSHKYYLQLETGQNCVVWEGIAVKVTGEAGLYLDKSSVSMKMGESGTATIQGTYITEEGKEWTYWADEKNPNFSTIHMIEGDTSVVTAEPDPKNGSILKLTAVAPGTTTITVQFDTSTRTATCDVTVTSDARLVLTPADSLRVVQGDTQTIEAKAWDGTQYVENPEITWESYNSSIATVDEKGVVTGVKKGIVGIIAKWNDIKSDSVQVTVVPSRTLSVTTTWDDDNNRDNKRPEKTTLQLVTTDGENVGDPVELNADNEWKYTWNHLASEDEDGQHISYLVTAVEDETLKANNYTAEVTRNSSDDDFVVTYKHEIEKTDITANVTWDDTDNQDGIRPKEVTLQLMADGEAVGDGITVRADNDGNWTKTWTGLAVNKEGAVGQAIEYTVEETGLPEGYTATVGKDEETGAITVKNSHTPAVKDLTVSAKWEDADDQDALRPASVDAVLYADGEATDKTVTLKAEENWTATIEGMPVYRTGKVGEAVEYTLKAAKEVDGYTSETNGTVLTFTHKTAVTSVTANVAWDDADNQDGIRPASVTLQLKADGVATGERITVDANDNWSKTWDNLPVKKAGKAIEYTVEETGLRSEYTQATTGTAAEGFTITNSYVPKGVDITVSVNWDDAENQDGIRPASVEAELYADNVSTNKKVQLTADSDWKATFEKLAVNKDGKAINYTLVATKVDGYEYATTGSGAEGLVLTYTHQVKKVDVTATVKWADGDNRDGVRPTSVNLQLKSQIEGEAAENVGDPIAVNEKANWTKTWTGLAEYKAGKKVVYTVEVGGLPSGDDGYTSEVTGDAATGFTVTATHVPAVADVTASIAWDDAENQDAIRPELVEAELYAGDVSTGKKVKLTADNKWTASFGEMDLKKDGKSIEYTVVATKVDGYDCTVEGNAAGGFTLRYAHTTDKTDVTVTTKWNDGDNQDGIRPAAYSVQLTADGENLGDSITLNEAGNFTKTWTGLEKNKAGKAIVYSVTAGDLAKGYTAAVENTESGIVVTLTHTPEVADIAVSAQWDDADNQDARRPESVEAEVLANGEATGTKVTLTAEGEWKGTVKALPVYAAGQKISYTLKADVDAYTSACTSTADGLVLKFTHKTEVADVTVTTKWNDKDNQDNNRPAAYSVQLVADGTKVGDEITLNASNNFSKTWTGLQKYRTGKVGEEIVYTVEVTGISEAYESSVSGNAAEGLVVTNTYIPATVEIPVSVAWDDADNQDGVRIGSVEAELYADGQATGNKVTLNAENSWTAKFAAVDVKKDGTRIKYEVKSTEAAGYTVAVSGNILADEGLVLTYKHVPATVNVTAKAAWDDADNQDGIRPTDTLLQLYADGAALGDKAVLESEKDWTKTWADLPKYKAGKEITYEVIASAVSGYTVNVSGSTAEGYTVAYAHSTEKTQVTVKNTWSDLDNVVDSRPSKLVVEIYANGKTTGKRVTLTSANKWTATVTDLDKNAAGKAVSYTGKVVGAPSGYSISIKASNGTVDITSKYTQYTRKLTVKLSKTTYVYNGKVAKPTVTVYNGNKKVATKYYTVTYKNNKNAGYATVIVKGKSNFARYAGKTTFLIRPKQMRKPSVSSTGKRTLAVKWVRDAQATKYLVQYSQSSKFTGRSTGSVTISKNTIGSTTLKGLTSGKYYYVRVRSYKVANGKNIYAPSWSQVVRIKVK